MRTVVIMGAGGRGYHDFNVAYRGDPNTRVVGFVSSDAAHLVDGVYPAELAGALYPAGIPLWPADELERALASTAADELVLASQDLPQHEVMHLVSRGLAAGANVTMLGPHETMLRSRRHVVAVTGVRTGSGKTQTSRRVASLLSDHGLRVAFVRPPGPSGSQAGAAAQCFVRGEDLAGAGLTPSVRQEISETLELGFPVHMGLDCGQVLQQVDSDADLVVWDGGGSDFPFIRPDLWIAVTDPLSSDGEPPHHPGEVNLRRADVVVVNKVGGASEERVQAVVADVRRFNPHAMVILAESVVSLEPGPPLLGRRALVLEDAAALLRGGHATGAGMAAARGGGASEIVDPRPQAVGAVAAVYAAYPGIGCCIPLLDQNEQQLEDVRRTIDAVDCDVVVVGATIAPDWIAGLRHPARRARYQLRERGEPTLHAALAPLERLARPMLTVATS